MDFIGAFSPANLNFLLEGFYVTMKVAVISIIFSFFIGGAIRNGTICQSSDPFKGIGHIS